MYIQYLQILVKILIKNKCCQIFDKITLSAGNSTTSYINPERIFVFENLNGYRFSKKKKKETKT